MTLPIVAIVGVGGLGCPAALAIALADAPCVLRLIDEDKVERGNLHRQSLFTEADVGEPKVEAARRALNALRPHQAIETSIRHVAPDTADSLLADAHIVVEGTDNLPTKFFVSDYTLAARIPMVHGACVGWQGTVLPVTPGASACYRCVFESMPENIDELCDCATAGVFGPVTSVVGALMAADALRLLRGDHSTAGHLARYDGWRQSFRSSRFSRRPGCPCGDAMNNALRSDARPTGESTWPTRFEFQHPSAR